MLLLIVCSIVFLQCLGIEYVGAEFIQGSYEVISDNMDPDLYYGRLCSKCRAFYGSFLRYFLDYEQLFKMQSALVAFCETLGPIRDHCASLFTFTMFKVINKSVATIDPVKSCAGWYLCYRKST
uniref:Saposin B-type domain-containing protein n=1 Tax=Trichobilharzia regenti TaxID=157069 RepID=A0AA85K8F9_TRIRE|nr:unnamed protein product [Trichobilharzia regenti]